MGQLLEIDNRDIAPHKREEYMRILQAIPPGKTIEAVCQLSDLERQLMLAGMRELYPELSHREFVAKIAWLWLPDDLWKKVYGPDSKYMNREQQCQENHS